MDSDGAGAGAAGGAAGMGAGATCGGLSGAAGAGAGVIAGAAAGAAGMGPGVTCAGLKGAAGTGGAGAIVCAMPAVVITDASMTGSEQPHSIRFIIIKCILDLIPAFIIYYVAPR